MILFQEHELEAEVPDFEHGGFRRARLLHRVDPLFGHGTRLIEGAKLQAGAGELGAVVERDGFCPFCADTIGDATAPFPEDIARQGRIIVGSAWVVPNVIAYSSVSAVGIYDVTRHFLPLSEMSSGIIYDVLLAVHQHARSVRGRRPELIYSSVNANYLPPSGSSLIHPHVQSSHDSVPLGAQARLLGSCRDHLAAYGQPYFDELIALEEVQGSRMVARMDPFVWLVPFAPSGFYEVWAIAPALSDLVEMNDPDIYQLASGLALVLATYEKIGVQSFNFSLMGATPEGRESGAAVVFSIVARAPVGPYYRSDVTYFERLCSESMIDYSPEEWAQTLRDNFGTTMVG
jgi:galactose-1-phosphate uridylyltransferase